MHVCAISPALSWAFTGRVPISLALTTEQIHPSSVSLLVPTTHDVMFVTACLPAVVESEKLYFVWHLERAELNQVSFTTSKAEHKRHRKKRHPKNRSWSTLHIFFLFYSV